MLQNLKRFSAKKRLRDYLKGNRPALENNGGKVGIILDFDLMDADFEMRKFREALGFADIDFFPIILSKQGMLPEKYFLEKFEKKNLAWNANFKNESKEQEFQNRSYEILLNYFLEPSPELLILSASVKANLKAGFPLEEKRLNDLEIKVVPKDYTLFATELKKYLKSLGIAQKKTTKS